MNYDNSQTLIIAYAVSNIIGLLFLWVAFINTKLVRFFFAVLFAWAAWINFTTACFTPGIYLDYGKSAINIYSTFINGWFANHITILVTTIAIGQGLIALGMLLSGKWVTLACIGTIVFLVSIAPLGLYAVFPFSITVSIAAWIVLQRDDKMVLWKVLQKQHI